MKRYFILGGGIAALSAAKAIRRNDPSGLIVLLTDEDALPYFRPALTKQLLGDLSAADIAVENAAWYDAPGRDILVLTGRTVSAIDTEKKAVSLADGLVFPYDKLVYALGARCFIPPFEGSGRENVIAVRTAEDAARVRSLAKDAKHAVVIGGGVLGLEAAWSLRQGGLSVSVVEFDARVMARQVDAETSEHIARAMKDHGVKLHTCASAASYDGKALTLADGRILPADLVIVSAGVRANAEIAAAAASRWIARSSWMNICRPPHRTYTPRATAQCTAHPMRYGQKQLRWAKLPASMQPAARQHTMLCPGRCISPALALISRSDSTRRLPPRESFFFDFLDIENVSGRNSPLSAEMLLIVPSADSI